MGLQSSCSCSCLEKATLLQVPQPCLSRKGTDQGTQLISDVRRPWVPSRDVTLCAQQLFFPAVPPLGGCTRLGAEAAGGAGEGETKEGTFPGQFGP